MIFSFRRRQKKSNTSDYSDNPTSLGRSMLDYVAEIEQEKDFLFKKFQQAQKETERIQEELESSKEKRKVWALIVVIVMVVGGYFLYQKGFHAGAASKGNRVGGITVVVHLHYA